MIIELVIGSLDVVYTGSDRLVVFFALDYVFMSSKVMRKGCYDFRVVFLDFVQRLDAYLEPKLLVQTSMTLLYGVCSSTY